MLLVAPDTLDQNAHVHILCLAAPTYLSVRPGAFTSPAW
jgi:hypothetical protein